MANTNGRKSAYKKSSLQSNAKNGAYGGTHQNAKSAASLDLFITLIAGLAITVVLLGSVIIAGRMTDGFKDFSFGFATREPVVYTYIELNAELDEGTVYTTWELGQLKQRLKVMGITVDGEKRELGADEYELSGNLALHNENNYSEIAVKHTASGLMCTVTVLVTVPQATGISAKISLSSTFKVTTLTNADELRAYIDCTVQMSDGNTLANKTYTIKVLTPSGSFDVGENDVEISCYGYKQIVKVFAESAGTVAHEHKFVNDKCTECGQMYYTGISIIFGGSDDFAVYPGTEAEDLRGYLKVMVVNYKGEESQTREYEISADFNVIGEDGYTTVLITHRSTGLSCDLKIRVIESYIYQITAQVAGHSMPEVTTETDVEFFREYTVVYVYTADGVDAGIIKDYTLRVLTPSGKFEVGINVIEVSYCGCTDTFEWEILR